MPKRVSRKGQPRPVKSAEELAVYLQRYHLHPCPHCGTLLMMGNLKKHEPQCYRNPAVKEIVSEILRELRQRLIDDGQDYVLPSMKQYNQERTLRGLAGQIPNAQRLVAQARDTWDYVLEDCGIEDPLTWSSVPRLADTPIEHVSVRGDTLTRYRVALNTAAMIDG